MTCPQCGSSVMVPADSSITDNSRLGLVCEACGYVWCSDMMARVAAGERCGTCVYRAADGVRFIVCTARNNVKLVADWCELYVKGQ